MLLVVVNCANISLPYGTLLDCYDELGTRYQLPVYVLSPPTNITDGEQSSIDSHSDNESDISDNSFARIAAADRERDYGGNRSSSSSSSSTMTTITNNYCRTTTKSSTTHYSGHNPIVREIKKHRRKQKSNSHVGNDSSSPYTKTTTMPTVNQKRANIDQDIEIPIKFRLSNGREHRLYCKQNDRIRNIKRRLAMLENGVIDSQIQRFYFGGKLLRKLFKAFCTHCEL